MYFQYKCSYYSTARRRKTLQPIAVFRAYQRFFPLPSISHCSLVGPRNIYTSTAKKRIEAHARHDVGVLPCYAGANNYRLSGPLIVLATLCLACQCLSRMTLYPGLEYKDLVRHLVVKRVSCIQSLRLFIYRTKCI
jgi:hypothetical protein